MCNEVPRQQYCSKIDGNENIWSFLLLILTISALVQIHKRRRIKPRRREPRCQLTFGRNSIPSCVNDILSHQMKWRYCTNEISDRLSFRFFFSYWHRRIVCRQSVPSVAGDSVRSSYSPVKDWFVFARRSQKIESLWWFFFFHNFHSRSLKDYLEFPANERRIGQTPDMAIRPTLF